MKEAPRISDRVLLHLLRYYDHPIEIVAPWTLTQDGIAANINSERKNVAIPLKKLEETGYLVVFKRHIKGSKTVRKIYTLTGRGKAKAEGLSDTLGDLTVDIVDLEGNRREAKLKDVKTFVTGNSDLLDVILAIRENVIDCRELQQRELRSIRKLVDMTEKMPIVRRFFGRKEELELLHRSIQKSSTKAMIISGIPGIGKTTLAAEFVKDLRKECDVYWLKIHEWTGLRGILTSIGEFLSAQGRSALLRSLETSDAIDLEKTSIIMSSDLGSARGIAVFDDFHKSDSKMIEAIRVIFRLLVENDSDFKLLLIGRTIQSFFDVRDLAIQKNIICMTLGHLDSESCQQILLSRGIPPKFHDEALMMAKGHPLCLELFNPDFLGRRPVEFLEFLDREISNSLSPIEMRVITAAALARYPLSPDVFLLSERIIDTRLQNRDVLEVERDVHSALVSLKERNLLFDAAYGTIDTHDLLRDFFISKAPPELRKTIHLALSQYYIDDDSPFSANEAIYHLTAAKDFDSALEVVSSYGDEIISRVGYQTMRSFIDAAIGSDVATGGSPHFMLIKAKVEEAEGNWNSALESLEKASKGKIDETTLIEIGRLQGNILLRKGKLAEAQALLMEAQERARKSKNSRFLALISCDLGNLLHRMGMLEAARTQLDQALDASELIGDSLLKGRTMYGIAKTIAANENFDEAIDFEEQALKILKQTGALSDQAKVLTSMGTYLDATDQLEKALQCQDEAFSLATESGDVVTQAYSLANGASTLLRLGRHCEAKERINRAFKVFSNIGDEMMLSLLYMLRGAIFVEEKDLESAEKNFQECIDLIGRSEQKYYLANWLIQIADLYESYQKTEAAIAHLSTALQICHDNSLQALEDYVEKKLKILRK